MPACSHFCPPVFISCLPGCKWRSSILPIFSNTHDLCWGSIQSETRDPSLLSLIPLSIPVKRLFVLVQLHLDAGISNHNFTQRDLRCNFFYFAIADRHQIKTIYLVIRMYLVNLNCIDVISWFMKVQDYWVLYKIKKGQDKNPAPF